MPDPAGWTLSRVVCPAHSGRQPSLLLLRWIGRRPCPPLTDVPLMAASRRWLREYGTLGNGSVTSIGYLEPNKDAC
jgi:hypothetical protein